MRAEPNELTDDDSLSSIPEPILEALEIGVMVKNIGGDNVQALLIQLIRELEKSRFLLGCTDNYLSSIAMHARATKAL